MCFGKSKSTPVQQPAQPQEYTRTQADMKRDNSNAEVRERQTRQKHMKPTSSLLAPEDEGQTLIMQNGAMPTSY